MIKFDDPLVQPKDVVQVPATTNTTTTTNTGEVVGQPTTKSNGGFWSKIGGILGGVAKTSIGILSGGGIVGALPGLLGGQGSYIPMLNDFHNQSMKSQAELLMFQQKVNRNSEEFAAITNLLKSRHDSEMQAVNNIKS